MKVLYLPPYSPDLNPIEKMWSKMNAILRCWKIRSLYYFLIKFMVNLDYLFRSSYMSV